MSPFRFSLLCVLAVSVAGCGDEATFTEPIPPLAAIHWVHAVPDTGAMDYRPVDLVSNAGLFDAAFRGSNMFYQGIEAGTRRIRVFMSSNDPAVTSVPIVDTTYNFSANQNYTFIHAGFSRTGSTPGRAVAILSDATPTLGPGQIAFRVVNFAPSFAGAIPTLADTTVPADAFVRRINALPSGTPEGSGLGFLAASSYAVVDTGRYTVALTATGTTGPAIVRAPVPLGTAGTSIQNPIAGSLIPGTVLTAVIVPRSVVGSAAPQGGTPAARAVEVTTRSTDTVTVQSGSSSVLTNRSPVRPDSVVGTTGTGAGTGAAAGNAIYVSGANEPEYNGWHAVLAIADSLSCAPTNPADTPTRCAATNVIATTRFRLRHVIAGTPTSPATGTLVYRIYTTATAPNYTIPNMLFLVDRRPPNTVIIP